VKPNCLGSSVLLLFAITVRLAAQQTEADRKLFADIRANAENGDIQSQSELGSVFIYGTLGVPKDEAEGVKWFRKAAEKNLALAEYNLGACYAFGQGVAKDQVEAVKWYRRAAEQNLAQAQFNLAVCYAEGYGLRKDETEAVNWYRKAAERNHAGAQNNLAACYEVGQGAEKDLAAAANFYRKAAERGVAEAQTNLGLCYHRGRGVPKDYAESLKWFRKAAEQNDARAQVLLGACYADGQGAAKDYVESYKWGLLALAQGGDSATQLVAIMEAKITKDQIAEGQKLARNFKSREMPSARANSSRTGVAQARPESCGTGFFITEDGYLITNEHVVKDATQVRLVTSAGLISAKVVQVDAANDLALLKADGRFAALSVAASRGVKLGGTVSTVGFPNIGLQGFAPKFARGEIASLSGAQDDARYFQISVPVQPGNSGGALVDEHGNVVGVVSARLSDAAALRVSGSLPQNVNYAVKSSYLLGFLESVPEAAAKLKEPETKERKFEEVVKATEQAAVLVLVY
jgi:TPR repeat protein